MRDAKIHLIKSLAMNSRVNIGCIVCVQPSSGSKKIGHTQKRTKGNREFFHLFSTLH